MATLQRNRQFTMQLVDAGELVDVEIPGWPGGSYTVQPKCSFDGVQPKSGLALPSPGQFVCVTHGVAFSSQKQKDAHLLSRVGAGKARKHRLAWWCWEHKAFEVP